jgi:23S rRNA pseudouridine955/2504/2580 synthase
LLFDTGEWFASHLHLTARVKSDKSNTYGGNVVSNIIRAKAKPPAAAKTRNNATSRQHTSGTRPSDRGELAPTCAPKQAVQPAAPLPKPAPAVRRVTIDEGSAGQRLDNFLLRELKGVPKTHVYRVIRAGEVRVNKGRAQADTRLELGDEVRVPPVRLPERASAEQDFVPAREFPIVYEDDHLIAVNKPAGIAVHGGSGVSFGVIEQLRRARPEAKFLELVHRLDKETSGLLLIAKKRSALTALQEQFRERETGKTYAALVIGDWADKRRVVDVPLLKFVGSDGERWVRAVENSHDPQAEYAKRSISLVKVVQRFQCSPHGASGTCPPGGHTSASGRSSGEVGYSLLDVTIKTGRTHQIRVHLQHAGHPIVGDPKYGDFEANKAMARGSLKFERMFLHAKRLRFTHPGRTDEIELLAPLPPECEKLIAALRESKKEQ